MVVGAGPNGLAAAITLARRGWRVQILEQASRIGGGVRTEPLTLPGFRHDVCSAVHPMAQASPFFQGLPQEVLGLEWVHPPVAAAHPFDGGGAAILVGSVEETAAGLGRDGAAYRRVVGQAVTDWEALAPQLLGPPRIPRHPLVLGRFGLRALRSAESLARQSFREREARGLFAGLAAHSLVPLEKAGTASFGLVLAAVGHTYGWPFPRGGAGVIARALATHLETLGGRITVDHPVRSLDDLPAVDAVLLDVTPRQLLAIAGERFPPRHRRRLRRFRYGPGVFKVDWALDGPIPWTAEACHRAGTVHLGGTLEEVVSSEAEVGRGDHPERPFVLLAQPSRFDPTRAPPGRHTAWAYCHVPHGSTLDMTQRIEAQVERFAPGFRSRVLARHTRNTRELELENPNLVGGDIGGGANDLRQLLFRPIPAFSPYRTPDPRVFLCSSSTPPGGGVHGMCGFHSARAVLRAQGA